MPLRFGGRPNPGERFPARPRPAPGGNGGPPGAAPLDGGFNPPVQPGGAVDEHYLDDGDVHLVAGVTAGQIVVMTGEDSFAIQDPGVSTIMAGLIAALPTPTVDGATYLETNYRGGCTFRYNLGGAAWVQAGAPVDSVWKGGDTMVGTLAFSIAGTTTKALTVTLPASYATNWLECDDSNTRAVLTVDQLGQVKVAPRSDGAATGASSFQADGYGATSASNMPRIRFRRASGTRGSETDVVLNQTLGQIDAGGWYAGGFGNDQAHILFQASENWNPTAGCEIRVGVTVNGGTAVSDQWRFANNGDFQLGTGFDANLKRAAASVLQTDGAFRAILSDAVTNTATETLRLGHNSSGTPAAGFGTRFAWQGKTSTTADRDMARLDTTWVVATEASQTGRQVYSVFDTAARECLRLEASGTAAMIGFLGHTASARVAAYTLAGSATRTFPTDPSSAYTGINNSQAGTPYAQLTDLNTVRTALSSLIGVVRQIVADLTTYGLMQ